MLSAENIKNIKEPGRLAKDFFHPSGNSGLWEFGMEDKYHL